jgi:ABC-type multidrug transport system ATPase subunit
MTIELIDIGKRFNSEWIFRHVNHRFDAGTITAIMGPNGSGKSTLLQCIAGYVVPSEGKSGYKNVESNIEVEEIFKHLSIASPYLQLNESLTLTEVIDLQRKFKPFVNSYTTPEIITFSGLQKSAGKQVKNFSSGMKQRLRLTLALMANTKILLLDEPLSNLDKAGEDWYLQMMNQFAPGRTVIICSNHHPVETAPSSHTIEISQFKVN